MLSWGYVDFNGIFFFNLSKNFQYYCGAQEVLCVRCYDCVLLRLTLTVLVMTIDAQWEGMGDVGDVGQRGTSRHYFPHARP